LWNALIFAINTIAKRKNRKKNVLQKRQLLSEHFVDKVKEDKRMGAYEYMLSNLNDGLYNNPKKYVKPHLDLEGYKAYRKAGADKFEEFRQDLFKVYEVEDNPKKEKCFSLAWEHGHSAGYTEVLSYFHDFVELIK
jgi:hypothetical protein